MGRKRYNFNSPWHGLEKPAAIICQKERLQIYEEQRNKEGRMASGEVLASRVSSARKFNTKG